MNIRSSWIPDAVSRFAEAADKNRIILFVALGYGFCRSTSGFSNNIFILNDANMWSDFGKIAGIIVFTAFYYTVARNVKSFPFFCLPFASAIAGGCIGAAGWFVGSREITIFGTCLLNAGITAMMLQWLEQIARFSPRDIVFSIASAELIGSLIAVLRPAQLLLPYLFLLLILSFSLTVFVCSNLETRQLLPFDNPARSFVKGLSASSPRLIIWVAVYCFAFGLASSSAGLNHSSFSVAFGNIAPCVIILATALFIPRKFDIELLRNMAFVFMVAGLLCLGFLSHQGFLSQVLANGGNSICLLFAYSLACMRAHTVRESAFLPCAIVKLAITFMMLLGVHLGQQELPIGQSVLVMVTILVVSVVSIFLSPFSMADRTALEKPENTTRQGKRRKLLEEVVKNCELSRRETTVFFMMTDGANAAEISEKLFISKGAVRAHMSRIYSKTGVANFEDFNEKYGGEPDNV